MRIIVKAKASAKQEKVEKLTQDSFNFEGIKPEPLEYKVWVKEPPIDGRANIAIIRALAKHFDIAQSCIRLISGQSAKRKVFELESL